MCMCAISKSNKRRNHLHSKSFLRQLTYCDNQATTNLEPNEISKKEVNPFFLCGEHDVSFPTTAFPMHKG